MNAWNISLPASCQRINIIENNGDTMNLLNDLVKVNNEKVIDILY